VSTDTESPSVDPINDSDDAFELLFKCCGSTTWARNMSKRRPFASWHDLLTAAEREGDSLDDSDWREAFAAHPRIGDREVLCKRFADSTWERGEQSGVDTANDDLLDELNSFNERYEHRFGHVFLICASGLTGEQMLDALKSRIGNEPQAELAIAAAEQRKITRIRLRKLIDAAATTGESGESK
jgi:2-oxo-4-hydroxy-4-carboxy-5-ureidoimidazoline decarboxylase